MRGIDGKAIAELIADGGETKLYTPAVLAPLIGRSPSAFRMLLLRGGHGLEMVDNPLGPGRLISGKSFLALVGHLAIKGQPSAKTERESETLRRGKAALDQIRKPNKKGKKS